MNDLTPNTAAQHAINDAFSVILLSQNTPTITLDDFVKFCMADPEYSRNYLARTRSRFMYINGPHKDHVAYMARVLEWKLDGVSNYIEHNHFLPEEQRFIYHRLQNHPDEFSSDDLHALLRHINKSADHPLRVGALAELERRLVSQAKQ